MIRFLVFVILHICLIVINTHQTCLSKPIKKISVDSSNNGVIDNRYFQLSIPSSLKMKEVIALRDYVNNYLQLSSSSEFDHFITIMNYVNHQWQHDGSMSPSQMSALDILQAASQGRKFSCIEYSKVFSDILHSQGYTARILGITSSDIAYGSIGVAHTVAEAWSNEFHKWVFFDPQFNLYARHKGIPLNYHEIAKLKFAGKFKEIELLTIENSKVVKLSKDLTQLYTQFIERYFSYMMCDMIVDGKSIMYVLPLDGKQQFLTSQGGNSKPMVFIDDPKELYFDINRTGILFNFNNDTRDIAGLVAEEQFKTKEDFLDRMGDFAAVPDFTLQLTTNTPWFSYYEVKLGNEDVWNKISGNFYKWRLNDGQNQIEVRSVNQEGRKGIVTKMIISYK